MQRAFAPVILNSENWRASRRMAGWMSPFTTLTGLGRPKCENIRRPRALAGGATLTESPRALPLGGILLVAAVGVKGSFALLGLLGADDEAGARAGGFDPCFGGAPLSGPPALAAAFAARCFSWSSLRSALVMLFWERGGGLETSPLVVGGALGG